MKEFRFLYDRYTVNNSPFLLYAYADIAFSRWDIAAEVCELIYKFQSLATYNGHDYFLFQTNRFYVITEKYPQKCVFV